MQEVEAKKLAGGSGGTHKAWLNGLVWADSGATNEIRSELHKELEAAIKSAEQIDRDAKAGMGKLVGGIESGTDLYKFLLSSFSYRERKKISWIVTSELLWTFTPKRRSLCPRPRSDRKWKEKAMDGWVASNIRFMQSKQGKQMFFHYGRCRAFIEASVPPECYEKCASTIWRYFVS